MSWLERLRIFCVEGTVRGLDRLAGRRESAEERTAHLETGIAGERAAYFYLCRKGYQVVARRWTSHRCPGDLDLVAWDGAILCIVEVKTRTAHGLLPAESAVDGHKREVLRRLARQYVKQLGRPQAPPLRFDVLSVYLLPGKEAEIVHFEACFGSSERRSWDRWD